MNPNKTRVSFFLRWLRNPKICRIITNEGAVYPYMYFHNSLHIARHFKYVSLDETDVGVDIFVEDIPLF